MGKRTIKIDYQFIKPIRPFLRKVKQRFNPEKMILFGSRTKGDALKSSDYDLLLVASEFYKYDMYQRMIEVYHLQEMPIAIDVLCLTPAEFEQRKKRLGIVQEAVKEGVDVIAAA